MVTDAEGSYTAQGERFGLTELVKALEDGGCQVTKAHRWTSDLDHTAGADITGFKFTQNFNPSDYDAVWLMGFASKNPDGPYKDPSGYELSSTEIELLAAFMNGGGGVFATGDHDDLGADLCGQVPRVRSMRRWTADYGWRNAPNPDTFVPDPTRSPPPVGRYRLDTLESGHDTHFEFQDQSDDIPQTIDPVMRVVRQHITHVAGGTVGFKESVPHRLLCGPDGVIRVLPDHMHEGRCLVPEDLGAQFTINGQKHDEYPRLKNGLTVSPEVVAWATVNARTGEPNFDDPSTGHDSNTNVTADYFPVIVAYNGHRAGVGRVAVDSTFHHFVNINVTGVKSDFPSEIDPVNPVDGMGFLASPEGQAHYAKIKAYWVNIAKWIARPTAQRYIAWSAFQRVAMDPRLKQTALGETDRLPGKYLLRHGASAWALMTETLSACTVFDFIWDIAARDPLSYLLSNDYYIMLTLPDPPPDEVIRRDLAVDKLELAYYALATAVTELRKPAHRLAILSGKLDPAEGMRIVQQGALAGFQRGMKEQAARMERTLRALKGAIALSDAAAVTIRNGDAAARPVGAGTGM
jgi:hypothetical protein